MACQHTQYSLQNNSNPQNIQHLRSIRPHHPDNSRRGHRECQVINQQTISKRFAQIGGLHHDISQPRSGWDVNLSRIPQFRGCRRGQQLVVPIQASLALVALGFGIAAQPFQFGLHGPGRGRVLFLFVRQPLVLGFQPRTVVAFVGNSLAPIQFQNPLGDIFLWAR